MMTQIRTGELKAVGRRSSTEYVILADTSPGRIPSEDDMCTISMCADVACIPLLVMFADVCLPSTSYSMSGFVTTCRLDTRYTST